MVTTVIPTVANGLCVAVLFHRRKFGAPFRNLKYGVAVGSSGFCCFYHGRVVSKKMERNCVWKQFREDWPVCGTIRFDHAEQPRPSHSDMATDLPTRLHSMICFVQNFMECERRMASQEDAVKKTNNSQHDLFCTEMHGT